MINDETHSETFLQAEARATEIAKMLEGLASSIQSYRSSAEALADSAKKLSGLADTQQGATSALQVLTNELRRLGVDNIERQLRAVDQALNGLRGQVQDEGGHTRAKVDESASKLTTKLEEFSTNANRRSEDLAASMGTLRSLTITAVGLSIVSMAVLIWLAIRG